mmetsp:Transcript_14494/g.29297  ORF Transcript_14494/g.29297 Transcript_14494/m.29297 type:complete len:243 (+) Transcript_14494:1018-1746(+)
MGGTDHDHLAHGVTSAAASSHRCQLGVVLGHVHAILGGLAGEAKRPIVGDGGVGTGARRGANVGGAPQEGGGDRRATLSVSVCSWIFELDGRAKALLASSIAAGIFVGGSGARTNAVGKGSGICRLVHHLRVVLSVHLGAVLSVHLGAVAVHAVHVLTVGRRYVRYASGESERGKDDGGGRELHTTRTYYYSRSWGWLSAGRSRLILCLWHVGGRYDTIVRSLGVTVRSKGLISIERVHHHR